MNDLVSLAGKLVINIKTGKKGAYLWASIYKPSSTYHLRKKSNVLYIRIEVKEVSMNKQPIGIDEKLVF